MLSKERNRRRKRLKVLERRQKRRDWIMQQIEIGNMTKEHLELVYSRWRKNNVYTTFAMESKNIIVFFKGKSSLMRKKQASLITYQYSHSLFLLENQSPSQSPFNVLWSQMTAPLISLDNWWEKRDRGQSPKPIRKMNSLMISLKLHQLWLQICILR